MHRETLENLLWSEVSTSCVVCPCACSCLRTGSWFGSFVACLQSTVDHVVTLWPNSIPLNVAPTGYLNTVLVFCRTLMCLLYVFPRERKRT